MNFFQKNVFKSGMEKIPCRFFGMIFINNSASDGE